MKKITILSLAIILILIAAGLNTVKLPSEYKVTSLSYGQDIRQELRLYNKVIGFHRVAPHTGKSDNLFLRIEYRGGARYSDYRRVTEIMGFGFLVPFLKYKIIFILAVILLAAALLGPLKEKFLKITIPLCVNAYTLALVFIGIAGCFITPARIQEEISRASFGGLILLPLFYSMWFTYLFAIIAGILLFLRKNWVAGVIAQAVLIFGLPYLIQTKLDPGWDKPGYAIDIFNPIFYVIMYAAGVALAVLFFTAPRVQEELNRKNIINQKSQCDQGNTNAN